MSTRLVMLLAATIALSGCAVGETQIDGTADPKYVRSFYVTTVSGRVIECIYLIGHQGAFSCDWGRS